VKSSIDLRAQQAVVEMLGRLQDPEQAKALGLHGERLLDPARATDPLVISLTVYERGATANHLRVQADNLDQPFDVNQGAKLDLGSTAKLRTLVTFLELIAEIRAELRKSLEAAPEDLRRLAADGPDPLTRWVANRLAADGDQGLPALLDAALERRYSASPAEGFFTGGGLHHFANFNAKDDARTVTVAAAMRHSINLPLIRMMRESVQYHTGRIAGDVIQDAAHPARRGYLERYAEKEARAYLDRFAGELLGLEPDQVLAALAGRVRPKADRLAVLFRAVRPAAPAAELEAFLGAFLPGKTPGPAVVRRLHDAYAPDGLTLADQAYLTRLHPLQIWLAAYLQEHEAPTRGTLISASAAARKASTAWLFKTRQKHAQDRRIREILEEDAFVEIHRAWARLGYPFPTLVPSLASAIGSSADRPEALAELVGIILNDGIAKPATRIGGLHFARGTPFEAVFESGSGTGRQVLDPAIAKVTRRVMIDVVEAGTARRLAGAFGRKDGQTIPIGAKTGTGDHRRKTFDKKGALFKSEVVNRTATVAFFIGDRLFGNLTIYVPGAAAADYRFTSSLPAQLLKALAPALRPLLEGDNEILTVEIDQPNGA
jgi:membrane peptidoglycan carboxypeptidase